MTGPEAGDSQTADSGTVGSRTDGGTTLDRDRDDRGDRGDPGHRDGGDYSAVRSFYGRWVGLYDAIARGFPRIDAVRRAAADACRLQAGDTVVEVGCGTGANLGHLRGRVGPTGHVVGVDVTRPALERARDRFGDVRNVHLLQGDGRDLPVEGPVDAVLGTFVTGMFADPVAVVDRWCDLAPGGHVVLVDAAPSRRLLATPLNALFRAGTVLSTPPTGRLRYDVDVAETLDRRVTAGHERLRRRSRAVATARSLAGFVRLTGGAIDGERIDGDRSG